VEEGVVAVAASTPARHSRVYAGYVLGFLTLISAFNYLDRAVLGLALPLIKRELVVSDTALGLASGLAFALFYTLLGLPTAWLADRWSRRNIIAVGFAFWSLMTALTGFVGNIWQLAGARFLMGAGEACGVAPSNSIISDLYPESCRPLALAVLGMASSLASLAFYPLIGWIGQTHGWREMFTWSGLPGFVLAVAFFFSVREPGRGVMDGRRVLRPMTSLPDSVRFLLGSRSYLLILTGSMFMGASVYAGSTWNATFLTRVHHLRLADVAASVGPLQGLCGGAGILLGGILTGALGRRDPRWLLRLPAIACLLAAPAEALFLLGSDRAAWMIGFGLMSFFALAHQAPIFAAAMSAARVRMRAVAISMLVLTSGLLGQIVGPLLVGVLDDRLLATLGASAVRYSLLIVALCMAGASLAFFAAVASFEHDRERAAA
jgi:predicted MFS family arabinose efflux permease